MKKYLKTLFFGLLFAIFGISACHRQITKPLFDGDRNNSSNGPGTHTSKFKVDSTGKGYFISGISQRRDFERTFTPYPHYSIGSSNKYLINKGSNSSNNMGNQVITLLWNKVDSLGKDIKPTVNDYRAFEKNVRLTQIKDSLDADISFILKHKGYIGQSVHKYVKSMSFTTKTEYDQKDNQWLNPIEEMPGIFTEEMFNAVVKDYLQYQITYITNELVSHSITCNSTDKLVNLMFEWRIEGKQKLIKIYTELLKHYK